MAKEIYDRKVAFLSYGIGAKRRLSVYDSLLKYKYKIFSNPGFEQEPLVVNPSEFVELELTMIYL